MKAHNLIFAIILVVISCNSFPQKTKPNNTLSITYKLDVKIISDSIPTYVSNYLLQKFGDSLKILINKDGSIRFDYFGNGKNGYEFNLYDIKTNHYYAKWKNNDTIYHYNVNSNTLKLIERKKLKPQKVNSLDCQVLKYKAVDSLHPNYIVNQTFYYNKGILKITPETYKHFKEFYFYDFLNESECMYVKKIIEMPEYRLTYALMNYKRNVKLNSNAFKIPNDLPLKEF